jgi:hypothetical protein
MKVTDLLLLGVVVEPRARKIVARDFAVPSGAIPVLAAIAFRDGNGESTWTKDIYDVQIAAPTLIRYYIRTLIRLKLVEIAHQSPKIKTLRPTSTGCLAIGRYERELRQGCTAFGQVRLMRVLTAPLVW